MLASSSRLHSTTNGTESAVAAVEELGGWASVAEALLHDCARVALVEAAEPAARQAVMTAQAEALMELAHQHVAATVQLQRRAALGAQERGESLAAQLRMAVAECEEVGEQLEAERAARESVESELQAATEERAAVWEWLRGACTRPAWGYQSHVAPPHATLEDHVRYLCERLRDAETRLAAREVGEPLSPPQQPQPQQPATSLSVSPRPVYRRILPSAPVNPVTASLLRVKEEVQQLRAPSVTQLQQAIGAYRPLRDEGLATTPPAAAGQGATPPPVDRPLGLTRSYTPQRSTASAVPSPRWRSHLSRLHEELKGLRRDLGTPVSQ